jgi:hypothetical protein
MRPRHPIRESGFYWVLFKGEWIVARHEANPGWASWWWAPGDATKGRDEERLEDDDFEEIDERRLMRVAPPGKTD